MAGPLKPPSQQTKRFFDIVPINRITPLATSRPIIAGKNTQLVDPMMIRSAVLPGLANPDSEKAIVKKAITITEPSVTPNTESQTTINETPVTDDATIEREYQEVKHELPAGLPVAEIQSVTHDSVTNTAEVISSAVVVHQEPPRRRHHLRIYMVVVLAIVIIVAAADVMLDSGVWKPSHNLPHTHFWQQSY